MKKRLAAFTAFIILLALPVTLFASADDQYHITIEATADKTEVEEGDTLTVTAKVAEITDPEGLAVLDYRVYYEKDLLEVSSFEVTVPKQWKDNIENGWFEDWTSVAGDDVSEVANSDYGILRWILISIKEGNAVKEAEDISVCVKFKAIGSGSASVRFAPGVNTNDQYDRMGANEQTVSVNITAKAGSNWIWIVIGVVGFIALFCLVFWLVIRANRKKTDE